MERILRQRHIEALAEALHRIPPGARQLVADVDYLVGVDPLFAGLHAEQPGSDGRSYRETAHACFPWHTADSTRTIVYPEIAQDIGDRCGREVFVFVHELGHQVDNALRHEHVPVPVSKYAELPGEAFAEAFTLFCAPDLCADLYGAGHYRPEVLARDHETLAMFERLRDRYEIAAAV